MGTKAFLSKYDPCYNTTIKVLPTSISIDIFGCILKHCGYDYRAL